MIAHAYFMTKKKQIIEEKKLLSKPVVELKQFEMKTKYVVIFYWSFFFLSEIYQNCQDGFCKGCSMIVQLPFSILILWTRCFRKRQTEKERKII